MAMEERETRRETKGKSATATVVGGGGSCGWWFMHGNGTGDAIWCLRWLAVVRCFEVVGWGVGDVGVVVMVMLMV
ncbi:Hypothetical predicted protein [Olea europaea subsp. europaea]|uniref:Uncharacterized protein n=1 Tax=Olea europaea subsp. europaea TaxID=158383 RepID=A0A8S0SHU2_OLEEU|nr:Hypothetical predicted protein [Olea europaea subsp. europaea]